MDVDLEAWRSEAVEAVARASDVDALQALIRHPTRDSLAILPGLLTKDSLPAVRRAAAQALLVGDPIAGFRECLRAADAPAVHWVLADATGAGLDPGRAGWTQWWLTQLPTRQWRADEWMFR